MGDLRCALLGSFVAFAVAVPAWAGDVYVMEYSQGKKPVIVKKDSFTPADVLNMGEGKPNKGFSYATALNCPGQQFRSPADTSMRRARSRFTTESSNTSSMSSAAAGN